MARAAPSASDQDLQVTFDGVATLEWGRADGDAHLIGPAGTGQAHRVMGPRHARAPGGRQFTPRAWRPTARAKPPTDSCGPNWASGWTRLAHLDITSTGAICRWVAAAPEWQGRRAPGQGP